MTESFTIVIPARYESSRLPGKVLRTLAGKPLLQHVYQCARASRAENVIIATDSEAVAEAARRFRAPVHMTSGLHRSGTDRIAELARRLDWDDDRIVVNLQGDEPLIPPALLDAVADDLARHEAAGIASLCTRIHDAEELFSPHAVKVVLDGNGYALYFSRAAIPWHRSGFAASRNALPAGHVWYRHIGLYGYRVRVLNQLAATPPPPLEEAEALEQLRALHLGIPIHLEVVEDAPPPGVDTSEDLARVAHLLEERR